MDFVLQYSDCYYDAIGEVVKTEAGNSVAVSSAMLKEMTSHAVLVKHETEFGERAYSVDVECVKFSMLYAVKRGSLAANTDYMSLANPRTNIIKYPKLALIMKLAELGWEPSPVRVLSSEYELGQAKVFDCRSSRRFVRIIIALMNLRVMCFVV